MDSGHGVQIPIVVTGSPWTEGEIAALIALAVTPGVGGPYRAAAIFEQLTSRSRASAMGQWRKLVAEGRVQRSVSQKFGVKDWESRRSLSVAVMGSYKEYRRGRHV